MKHDRKTKLDLGLLLPADDADPCVERLRAHLEGRSGVEKVHITRDGGTAELCVHFDPDRLSARRVAALAEAAGAELSDRFTHLDLPLPPMSERRTRLLGVRAGKLAGVSFAAAAAGALHIELERGADRREVEDAVGKLLGRSGEQRGGGRDHEHDEGEHDDEDEHDGHDHEPGAHAHGTSRLELGFSVVAGVLTLVGWLFESLELGGPAWAGQVILINAYFFGSFFALREVREGVLAGRLQIDFLMLVAAIGAAAVGEWTEGALLLFLFSLGHSLEGYAMGRAKRAIEALADLAPKTATVLREGGEEEVPVEELELGDRILVRPNQRIAADGFVVAGTSAVNQAPITGESMPVDKHPVADADEIEAIEDVDAESRLFAGTINGGSALQAIVMKTAEDSTLARVVTMVREAQTQQSPTQRFTDRVERIFVPAVLALVVVSLFAWTVVDEPFSASFYRAMALLVAASPCALAIATPSAVLSGIARAARGGVLIKGGAHLETLGMVNVIAFDKTGTLTQGEPRLTDIEPADGVSEIELLRVAAAVEEQSDHPLARAVVERAAEDVPEDDWLEASDVQSITGFGIQATVAGQNAYLGKVGLFTERLERQLPPEIAASAETLGRSGRTTIVVSHGERFLGVLGLMDPPRATAKATLAALHDLGVERLLMLTGDHEHAAQAVAAEVGLDDVQSDLLPEDKVKAIEKAVADGELIAMVGDGVNDAPAMAKATVGIAMGAGGSDVALETADVALMADDLTKLPFAVGLSRASRRIIQQNLWVSLGMVAFLIPATLTGFAGIGWAVALHEGSTLIVVVNALRLLAYKD